ncbi:hypothetical protein AFA_07025 [Alcaligenes faecalis]|uniref:Lipoprotein n=1 Tax=Alcaligenes faecalis TaxID=511 RepID=A0AB33CY33_ALCFA|nr:hypothetical protein AFA_07025 [Alcaligenes faecalis]AWG36832.1 hypothetical protein CA948_02765 [Alcaligenes aquatilis]
MKTLFLALTLTSILSACAVHTPRGSVIVDPDGHGGYGQRHCPPGQAKKGNC